MWIDNRGKFQTVSLDSPERLLTAELVQALAELDAPARSALSEAIDAYLPEMLDSLEAMVPSPSEAKYVGVEPPNDLRLQASGPNHLSSALIRQLRDAPLRWRADLTIALLTYVQLDLAPDRTDV